MSSMSDGPPLSKTDYVLDRLRRDIRSGQVNPGQALRQADLAKRYGVSPTPVREALRVLEAEGTISYLPHKGATVSELSPRRVEDLYRLRSAVESLATRVAVERFDEADNTEQVLELHQRIKDGLDQVDGESLAVWNRELHFAIYHGGSALLSDHTQALWRYLPPEITIWRERRIAVELIEQHERIVAAYLDRDADRAAEVMAAHIWAAYEHRVERDAARG